MFGLKFLAIMRRDLKKLTRNPITLISVILMPIVYLVIIGNSFQGQLSICRSSSSSRITVSMRAASSNSCSRCRRDPKPSTSPLRTIPGSPSTKCATGSTRAWS